MSDGNNSTSVNTTNTNTNEEETVIIADQARDLPEITSVKFNKIDVLSETSKDVNRWFNAIKYAVGLPQPCSFITERERGS